MKQENKKNQKTYYKDFLEIIARVKKIMKSKFQTHSLVGLAILENINLFLLYNKLQKTTE